MLFVVKRYPASEGCESVTHLVQGMSFAIASHPQEHQHSLTAAQQIKARGYPLSTVSGRTSHPVIYLCVNLTASSSKG